MCLSSTPKGCWPPINSREVAERDISQHQQREAYTYVSYHTMWRLRPRAPGLASRARCGAAANDARRRSLDRVEARQVRRRGPGAPGRALPRRGSRPCDATTSRHRTNRYALRRVSWNRIFSNPASLGSARRLGHELGGRWPLRAWLSVRGYGIAEF